MAIVICTIHTCFAFNIITAVVAVRCFSDCWCTVCISAWSALNELQTISTTRYYSFHFAIVFNWFVYVDRMENRFFFFLFILHVCVPCVQFECTYRNTNIDITVFLYYNFAFIVSVDLSSFTLCKNRVKKQQQFCDNSSKKKLSNDSRITRIFFYRLWSDKRKKNETENEK